jgi:uncharacterized Zn finger protein
VKLSATTCPYCGSQLTEARVSRENGRTVLDERGPDIKSKCERCGRFIGMRPVNPRATKTRELKETTEG